MGYQVTNIAVGSGAAVARTNNIDQDSAHQLLALNNTQLLSSTGATWAVASLNSLAANFGRQIRVLNDEAYAPVTFDGTNWDVYKCTAGTWATTSFPAVASGVSLIYETTVLAGSLYVIALDNTTGTTVRILKYTAGVWSNVTAFFASLSGNNSFTHLLAFNGNLYVMDDMGALYTASAGGVLTQVVAPIWSVPASVRRNFSVQDQTAQLGGLLYTGCLRGSSDTNHAASLWTWDGVAATWTPAATYLAAANNGNAANTNPASVAALGGSIYLATNIANGAIYQLVGGALTALISLTGSNVAFQLIATATDLYIYGGCQAGCGQSPQFNLAKLTQTASGAPGGGMLPAFVPGF